MIKHIALATPLALALAVPAQASSPIPYTASASGGYGGSLSYLNDGDIPPLGQYYQTNTVYNFGSTTFTLDFGGAVHVTDVLASVDNNDDYTVALYDGSSLVHSFSIPASAGTVPVNPGGMDLFTSYPLVGATQLGSAFSVTATKAVISASGGDGLYAYGEVQFFNNGVPEPASWALMITGLGLVGAAMRRQSGARLRLA